MEDLNGVSKRLVIAREACRMVKYQVAKGLGVHPSTIMRWEEGHRRPKQADIEGLASIYQVEPDWLLSGALEDAPTWTPEHQSKAEAVLRKMQEDHAEVTSRAFRRSYAIPVGSDPRHQIGFSVPVTEETRLLDGISDRVRQILLAQNRLPVIPEVSFEVLRGIRDGVVVPSSWLVFKLARHLDVYEYWLLKGEPSKDQSCRDETE